jgi:hypothetical protein
MKQFYTLAWVAALSLAVGCILALLIIDRNTEVIYPGNFASAMNANIVFIGSSLTAQALPVEDPEHGILGDGRSSAILSVAGLSERLSNQLLAHAIESGVETVLLEINPYAQDHRDLGEPAFLASGVRTIRETGARMRSAVRPIFNLGPHPNHVIRLGGRKFDRILEAKQLQANDYYGFLKIQPIYSDELQNLMARAREAKVEVIFFSPPRPQSTINVMGSAEFADLNSHLNRIAASFGVPLWYSPIPWPDDHFMDVLAHPNVRGRIRFQEELALWYGARQ